MQTVLLQQDFNFVEEVFGLTVATRRCQVVTVLLCVLRVNCSEAKGKIKDLCRNSSWVIPTTVTCQKQLGVLNCPGGEGMYLIVIQYMHVFITPKNDKRLELKVSLDTMWETQSLGGKDLIGQAQIEPSTTRKGH